MSATASRPAPAHAGDGFSVIEAIVALAIVASGVLALAALAAQVTRLVQQARIRTVAAQLADAVLIDLTARGVAPSSADCLRRDVPGCVAYRDAHGAPSAPRDGFAVRWRAAAVPGSPVPATLVTVCAVAPPDRPPAARPAGACVTRIRREPWP